jgi:CRISPR-associated protein Cmr2
LSLSNVKGDVEGMSSYTAITFSPVQGFIEKSRKLRDLYGASLILSYLSKKLVDQAQQLNYQVISPGLPNLAKGMPNRILIQGNFPQEQVIETIRKAWKEILKECKDWLERNISVSQPDIYYHWDRDWEMWGVHTWEIFWGQGNSISEAMADLENNKLSRNWTGINWIGETSSITGTDSIAWNGLGKGTRNPKTLNYQQEKQAIADFYRKLSEVLDKSNEGKVIDDHERLSIPELVKRLITLPNTGIPQRFKKEDLPFIEKFTELQRKPEPENNKVSQWTGWFMGDGDKVGDYLKSLQTPEEITAFSEAMRNWGKKFQQEFEQQNLGRVIYAGGDDFLGIFFDSNPNENSSEKLKAKAVDWLLKFKDQWAEHGQDITVSVGFVWVAGSVPQRDVLQHCREAEKVAKNQGRNRVTIRILFNSGQYVQWTCPWDELGILKEYQDRDKGTNWTHVYNDFAQLKARHAIVVDPNVDLTRLRINNRLAIDLMNIYFHNKGEYLRGNVRKITDNTSQLSLVQWIDDFIKVGWQLCS